MLFQFTGLKRYIQMWLPAKWNLCLVLLQHFQIYRKGWLLNKRSLFLLSRSRNRPHKSRNNFNARMASGRVWHHISRSRTHSICCWHVKLTSFLALSIIFVITLYLWQIGKLKLCLYSRKLCKSSNNSTKRALLGAWSVPSVLK